MIKVEHVSLTLKKQKILEDICLEAARGEAVGLIGGNGCGKTMLMKCICGFHTTFTGRIMVAGRQICKDVEFAPSTGFILETPGFIPYLSGLENLKILAGINCSISLQDVRSYMELVGLEPDDKKSVKKYSLGMRQRLGIAQALMEDPEVLILDEPFNGLDRGMLEKMRDVLCGEKEKGKTILIASHNERDIEYICDRTYSMDAGRVVQ